MDPVSCKYPGFSRDLVWSGIMHPCACTLRSCTIVLVPICIAFTYLIRMVFDNIYE